MNAKTDEIRKALKPSVVVKTAEKKVVAAGDMSHMLGKVITVRCDGMVAKGKMIADHPDRIVLEGDGVVVNVVKSKIAMFGEAKSVVEDKSVETYPIYFLACCNPEIKCKGVRYVKTMSEPKKEDYEKFMAPCKSRVAGCKSGCLAELGKMPRKALVEVLGDTMYGDYPEA